MGNSRIPLYCIIASVSLNVVLDILLVAVYGMGVSGAALATVIGQGVSFAAALVFCLRHRESLGLLPRYLSPEKEVVSRTLKLGLPVALQWTIASVSWLVVLTLVNKYGVVRRKRIYYLRDLTGKKARIKEKRVLATK